MIVHKSWVAPGIARRRWREGWFLLGFLPLYVRDAP